MSINLLTHFEILQGIFTFTFLIITQIVGIRILLKYVDSKKAEHVTMGLAWIFLTSAWWGSTAKFMLTILSLRVNTFFLLFIGSTVP